MQELLQIHLFSDPGARFLDETLVPHGLVTLTASQTIHSIPANDWKDRTRLELALHFFCQADLHRLVFFACTFLQPEKLAH